MSKIITFITGANKGLGFETARQLGLAGHTIILGSRNEAAGKKALARLQQEAITAHALAIDMTKPETFVQATQFFTETFGKLDCLINNAGTADGDNFFTNTALSLSPETVKTIFQTNFFGLVELTQCLVPLLEKSERGIIVNLSSILGSITMHGDPASPIYNSKGLAYNASKASLNMFTLHLAHALKRSRISVYSAHPGWVKTDLGTAQAPTETKDGVKTVVDLVLGKTQFPSGSFVHLDKTLPW